MRLINILLVDDDQLDVLDIKRTFEKMGLVYKLMVAKNGEEGLYVLNEIAADESGSLPDIILLDINMSRMNGLEFLEAIRNSEKFKHLKCFILTTSEEKVDKIAAEKLGISGYVVKPLKLNKPSSMDAFNLTIDLMNLKDYV